MGIDVLSGLPGIPVRGIDRVIVFHLRRSPALREFLLENFERFPFTRLTLLCLKNETRDRVEADLHQLVEALDVDDAEIERRKEFLQLFQSSETREPMSSHRIA